MYVHLYITIKPLGYQSLTQMSFEFGDSVDKFDKNHSIDPGFIAMGDPLTLKNTKYLPQVKKEDSEEN